MSRYLVATLLLVASSAVATPAFASSMPAIDQRSGTTLGVGVGNGSASFGADFRVNNQMTLGFGLGSTAGFAGRVDVRGIYRLNVNAPFLVGIVGGLGLSGPAFSNLGTPAPMVGLALGWHFLPNWTLRGNFVVNPLNFGNFGNTLSGAEIAYRFSPAVEVTVGGNGRGDFLGLKFAL